MTIKVDLNCDMGESFGLYNICDDEEVMKYVTSANVACGFHASDPHVMRRTVELAKKYGVAVGAHPGFPDLVGFGRRAMSLSKQEIKDIMAYQVGALREFLAINGMKLHHIKPHGMLYDMACEDAAMAEAIAESIAEINPKIFYYALDRSELDYAAAKKGLNIIYEGYSDWAHTNNGLTVRMPAPPPGADIPSLRAERVLRMIREHRVISNTGEDIELRTDSICVHGDNPDSVAIAKKIHEVLTANGIEIAAP